MLLAEGWRLLLGAAVAALGSMGVRMRSEKRPLAVVPGAASGSARH